MTFQDITGSSPNAYENLAYKKAMRDKARAEEEARYEQEWRPDIFSAITGGLMGLAGGGPLGALAGAMPGLTRQAGVNRRGGVVYGEPDTSYIDMYNTFNRPKTGTSEDDALETILRLLGRK